LVEQGKDCLRAKARAVRRLFERGESSPGDDL